MNDLISVIIPIYNSVTYLPEALQSLCGQTYTNWEGLLIDDGSSDGSAAVCDKFALQDSRFRVFHRTNHGTGKTRNFGIAQAAGEFITFMDHDDIAQEHWLETLVTPLKAYPQVDFVVTKAELFYEETGVVDKQENYTYLSAAEDAPVVLSPRLKSELTSRFIEPWRKISRIEFIRNNHIIFAENENPFDDMLFHALQLYYAKTAYFSSVRTYSHRMYAQSIYNSALKNPDSFFDFFKTLDAVIDYSKIHHCDTKTLLENVIPIIEPYKEIVKSRMKYRQRLYSYIKQYNLNLGLLKYSFKAFRHDIKSWLRSCFLKFRKRYLL